MRKNFKKKVHDLYPVTPIFILECNEELRQELLEDPSYATMEVNDIETVSTVRFTAESRDKLIVLVDDTLAAGLDIRF